MLGCVARNGQERQRDRPRWIVLGNASPNWRIHAGQSAGQRDGVQRLGLPHEGISWRIRLMIAIGACSWYYLLFAAMRGCQTTDHKDATPEQRSEIIRSLLFLEDSGYQWTEEQMKDAFTNVDGRALHFRNIKSQSGHHTSVHYTVACPDQNS